MAALLESTTGIYGEQLPECSAYYATDFCAYEFVQLYGYDQLYTCRSYDLYLNDLANIERKKHASYIIFGCLLNAVCTIGFLGNVLAFRIMRTREFRRSTTAIYLQILMVVDSLFLAANLFHHGLIQGLTLGHWWITALPAYSRVYVQFILIDLFRNASVLLTVAVTVERYIFVCHSLHAAKLCTARNSRIMCTIALLVALIYAMPRFFMLKVDTNYPDDTSCDRPEYRVVRALILPDKMEEILGYIGAALFFVIPLILLIVLTILLLVALGKSSRFRKGMMANNSASTMRRAYSANMEASTESVRAVSPALMQRKVFFTTAMSNTERNITVVLLSVVITFIVCNLPNIALAVAQEATSEVAVWKISSTGAICFYIATLLINVNSAINVLLFCFFGKKFRTLFIEVYFKCRCQSRARSTYRHVSQTQQSQISAAGSGPKRPVTLQSYQSVGQTDAETVASTELVGCAV